MPTKYVLFKFFDVSQRIHKEGFLTIRDVAFMHETPFNGHLMSPLATVCIYLHVQTNFIGLHFQFKKKINSLLKLTNQQHLLKSCEIANDIVF